MDASPSRKWQHNRSRFAPHTSRACVGRESGFGCYQFTSGLRDLDPMLQICRPYRTLIELKQKFLRSTLRSQKVTVNDDFTRNATYLGNPIKLLDFRHEAYIFDRASDFMRSFKSTRANFKLIFPLRISGHMAKTVLPSISSAR
jgi:hypothetical protein